jgi:hypothetical protein
MCGTFQGKCLLRVTFFHGHVLLALYVEDIDDIRILFKATIFCPIPYNIVLYYHTVFYFFVVFCGFIPYTDTICRGECML